MYGAGLSFFKFLQSNFAGSHLNYQRTQLGFFCSPSSISRASLVGAPLHMYIIAVIIGAVFVCLLFASVSQSVLLPVGGLVIGIVGFVCIFGGTNQSVLAVFVQYIRI